MSSGEKKKKSKKSKGGDDDDDDDEGQHNEKKKKKKKKKKRKYVLVGVGDSNVLEDRRYFRSNQNSAEECNAAARFLDALLEKEREVGTSWETSRTRLREGLLKGNSNGGWN